MDRSCLVNHSLDVNWEFPEGPIFHVGVEDEHYLLGSPDGRDWYQHLSAFLDGIVDDADELALYTFSIGHDIVWPTVGAFDDERFSSGEQRRCWVEHHGPSELEVGTIDDVVETLSNVEVDHRASENRSEEHTSELQSPVHLVC